jgi:hypothetical protein
MKATLPALFFMLFTAMIASASAQTQTVAPCHKFCASFPTRYSECRFFCDSGGGATFLRQQQDRARCAVRCQRSPVADCRRSCLAEQRQKRDGRPVTRTLVTPRPLAAPRSLTHHGRRVDRGDYRRDRRTYHRSHRDRYHGGGDHSRRDRGRYDRGRY